MTERELIHLRGLADSAHLCLADARAALAMSHGAETIATCQRAMQGANVFLVRLRVELDAELAPRPSCPMCGPDGKPGQIAMVETGRLVACPVCHPRQHYADAIAAEREDSDRARWRAEDVREVRDEGCA